LTPPNCSLPPATTTPLSRGPIRRPSLLAEVLLDALGQSFSSHRAPISAYGQEFAKTGRLDARFHRLLIAAFEKRQQADYLPQSGLIAADVAALANDIRQFRSATVAWLDGQPPKFCPPTSDDD